MDYLEFVSIASSNGIDANILLEDLESIGNDPKGMTTDELQKFIENNY